jgi:hypothetical protein
MKRRPQTLPLFDADLGAELKTWGMHLVLDNAGEEWSAMAQELMLMYIRSAGPCPTERARLFALECGLLDPPHPNAWGAAVGALSKTGSIQMTGQFVKAGSVAAHARLCAVWGAV